MAHYVAGGLFEKAPSTGATRRYYALAGRPVALRDSSGVRYLHPDHLGSVALETTAGGTWAGHAFRGPFGQPWLAEGTLAGAAPSTDRGYTGQRSLEPALGSLYHYQARWYSPVLGRFLQPDPIVPRPGDPQDLNRYTCVRNNPARYDDPTGQTPYAPPEPILRPPTGDFEIRPDLGRPILDPVAGPSGGVTVHVYRGGVVVPQVIGDFQDGVDLVGPFIAPDRGPNVPSIRAASNGSGDDNKRGPVILRPPPGASDEEIEQLLRYCEGCNEALEAGALSPIGRVSTKGALRDAASEAADAERKAAADRGAPYGGQAGHVPDTTWTGQPDPYRWLDLTPRVNSSLGGQARGYPLGYEPTRFVPAVTEE